MDVEKDSLVLLQGWGKKKRKARSLGENTMKVHGEIVKKWFDEGVVDGTKKRSAAMMRIALENMYPGVYDLPSENQIRSKISRLVYLQKEREKAVAEKELNCRTEGGALDKCMKDREAGSSVHNGGNERAK